MRACPFSPIPQASHFSGPAVRLYLTTGNYDDTKIKVQLAVLRPNSASENVALDHTVGYDAHGQLEFSIEPVSPGDKGVAEVHISGFVHPLEDNEESEDGEGEDDDFDDEDDEDDDDEDDEEDEEDEDEDGESEDNGDGAFFSLTFTRALRRLPLLRMFPYPTH